MHNIREDSVMSGGNRGQLLNECAGFELPGVQMPEAIQLRDANEKQVHQMAVVRNQVIQSIPGGPGTKPGRDPARFNTQKQAIPLLNRGADVRRLVNVAGVERRLRLPPAAAQINNQQHDCSSKCRRQPASTRVRRARLLADFQLGFPASGGRDAHSSTGQQQHQPEQQRAQRLLHRQHPLGN